MAREIKFRAWFELQNKMVHHEVLCLSYANGEGFEFAFDESTVDANGQMEGTMNFELMQYTGLRDKNGMEIYEGDVVKMPLGRPNCAVTWWGTHWLTFVLVSDLSLVEKEGYGDLARYGNHVEVIGNIYENPELLNASTVSEQ